ncbi:MAG TPA: hypothetical protein VFF12_04980 [Myxococcaceae bacterium]|nr:hypothetical protein [Myxococcaceae bacterium]
MRKVLAVASLSILASACGGSDTSNPVAACNSFASAVCNKASSCQVQGITSACAGNLQNALDCAHAGCSSGQSFDSGAAGNCINDINGLSCTDAGNDLSNGTLPSSCNNVCH